MGCTTYWLDGYGLLRVERGEWRSPRDAHRLRPGRFPAANPGHRAALASALGGDAALRPGEWLVLPDCEARGGDVPCDRGSDVCRYCGQGREGRWAAQARARREERRARIRAGCCADCGAEGERVGHMGCQYPGRVSEGSR